MGALEFHRDEPHSQHMMNRTLLWMLSLCVLLMPFMGQTSPVRTVHCHTDVVQSTHMPCHGDLHSTERASHQRSDLSPHACCADLLGEVSRVDVLFIPRTSSGPILFTSRVALLDRSERLYRPPAHFSR
jgi:hypothetical protein